jgi:TatA/E family protein of Tat protein translocase
MLHSLFLIGSFGTTEMLLILFVVILLFGAKRIPELFRGMGQGVREFKDASTKPEERQPEYRDQPAPPYQQQYPPQGYPQQGYPQQPQQGGYAPQPPQPGQPGYQQPAPSTYGPNDPNRNLG